MERYKFTRQLEGEFATELFYEALCLSRANNCYGNAVGESLFSRLKAKLLRNGTFLSLEDAEIEIFKYIEIYYNRIPRYSSWGFQSPEQFEEKYKFSSPQKYW